MRMKDVSQVKCVTVIYLRKFSVELFKFCPVAIVISITDIPKCFLIHTTLVCFDFLFLFCCFYLYFFKHFQ